MTTPISGSAPAAITAPVVADADKAATEKPAAPALPEPTTTLAATLFVEAGAGTPLTGKYSFTPEIPELGSVAYQQNHWMDGAAVGAGLKWTTTKTVEVKAKETKETAAATGTDAKAKPATPAPAPATEPTTTTVQSGWQVSAMFGSKAMGLTAPDIVDGTYVTYNDASMALHTLWGGVDLQRNFAGGFSLGLRPYLGMETTCDSTGEYGSVDCDSGSIITNSVTHFYMDDKKYIQMPHLVGGVMVTGAYDIWSPKNIQDGGVSLFVQADYEPVSTYGPADRANVDTYGGSHVYTDSGRHLASTFGMDEAPLGIVVGLRVEGDPFAIGKNRGSFLGRQLSEPKPAPAPAPERKPEF